MLYFNAVAGLIAGLFSAMASGIIFLLVELPDSQGAMVPFLTVLAGAFGLNDASVFWSFYLLFGALVGAVYAIFLGGHGHSLLSLMFLGVLSALVAFGVLGLTALPTLLTTLHSFTTSVPMTLAKMRACLLVSSLVYGAFLGAVYFYLTRPLDMVEFKG